MTLTYRGLRLVYLLLILVLGGCTTVSEPINDKPIPTPSLTATLENTNSSATTPASTPTSTEPAPTPGPTITVAPTMTAAEIPLPDPTVAMPAPSIVGLENTLLLYATIADMRTSLNRPSDVAPYDDYWAFRTLPPLPGLDPTVFETLYGPYEAMEPGRFFFDLRPQLSPNGRYIVVAGLSSYPEYGVEGTGMWLIDLEAGAARQLLPDGVIATWNPASDAITYATGGTLYTLNIVEGATPMALFQSVDLWNLYIKWSPDGHWITAVTGVQHEPTGEEQTDLTFTYMLIPADGGPARKLAERETYGGGYTAEQASWSPDGQLLMALLHEKAQSQNDRNVVVKRPLNVNNLIAIR